MPDFTDYLSRCQYLLQQGRPVADVLWYLGDELDHKPMQKTPFPAGYQFDYINFDALVNRLQVENGRLTIPEGTQWRVLWLPPDAGKALRPETLAHIQRLLEAGATVIGSPPQHNPSLGRQRIKRASDEYLVQSPHLRRGPAGSRAKNLDGPPSGRRGRSGAGRSDRTGRVTERPGDFVGMIWGAPARGWAKGMFFGVYSVGTKRCLFVHFLTFGFV